MKLVARLIFSTLANCFTIWLTAYFVKGFIFQGTLINLLVAAAIFTLINFFIRPLLRFFSGPLIFFTFGIFAIVVNAFLIYLLDNFSPSITINGPGPLILATLIISLINGLINSLGIKT